MAHTKEETLPLVQEQLPETADVTQCYPDDDRQWWAENSDHNTIGYAWWDLDEVLHVKGYHP